MGLAFILWVQNDMIRDAEHRPETFRSAIGDAVIELCQSAQWSDGVPNSATVLNWHNSINRAGEMHSSWQGVYLWAGNCLWSAHDLSDQGLKRARELIDEEIERRMPSNA